MKLKLLEFYPSDTRVKLCDLLVRPDGKPIMVQPGTKVDTDKARLFVIDIKKAWLEYGRKGQEYALEHLLEHTSTLNGKVVNIPFIASLTLKKPFSRITAKEAYRMVAYTDQFLYSNPEEMYLVPMESILEEYIFDYSQLSEKEEQQFTQRIDEYITSFLEGHFTHRELIEELANGIIFVERDSVFSKIEIDIEKSLQQTIALYDETSASHSKDSRSDAALKGEVS